MNKEKLRAEHPELYATIVAEGQTQERDRVGAWMAFVDVDPKAVAEGIKKGDSLSQTAMAELSRKALSATKVAEITADSAPEVQTEEAKKAADAKTEAFKAEVKAGIAKNGLETAK